MSASRSASGSTHGRASTFGGRCIKFGDSVNTDVIIPGRYLVSIDPTELAEHVFEALGPEVQARVKGSAVIVAGANFGCGSAREQAASGLVGAGIKAIVARSFARTFFRNCINTGLWAVECSGAVEAATDDTDVYIDRAAGLVIVEEKAFPFANYPEALQRILDSGGLIPYLASYVLPARR